MDRVTREIHLWKTLRSVSKLFSAVRFCLGGRVRFSVGRISPWKAYAHIFQAFSSVCVWCVQELTEEKRKSRRRRPRCIACKGEGSGLVVGAAWRCTPEGKNDRSGKFPSFYGFSVLFWRFVALFFRPVRSVGSQLDLHNPDSSRYQCNKSKRPCYPGLPVLHFFFRSLLIACQ